MSHFLTRMQLLKTPSNDALKLLIDPENRALAMDAHHRLIWSAFAGHPNQQDSGAPQKSEFLWRAEGKGSFLVLSRRHPQQSPLFEKFEIKPFSPQLGVGDILHFILRVNATKTRPEKYLNGTNGKPNSRRVDIVMHELYGIEKGAERKEQRLEIAHEVAAKWLSSQGEKHGFTVKSCGVVDYSTQVLPSHRGARKGQPQFGVLDLTGSISVTEPIAFVNKLMSGFGRAKAFGCGLMLIRRA
jgi:CRISPR system Cascade subunit CasE